MRQIPQVSFMPHPICRQARRVGLRIALRLQERHCCRSGCRRPRNRYRRGRIQMINKLTAIIAAGGILLGLLSTQAATPTSDYDLSPVRKASASVTAAYDEPPADDELDMPQLKSPILQSKKLSTTKTADDAQKSKPKLKSTGDANLMPPSGSAPNLTSPNLKSHPAYASGPISNWPQATARSPVQKAGANFDLDPPVSGTKSKAVPASSLNGNASTSANTTRAGQIQRPSQQFAKTASAVSDYHQASQSITTNPPSSSYATPPTPNSPSMSESVRAGMPMNSDSAVHLWDEGGTCESCNSCGRCNSCCYNGINLCGDCGWFYGADYLLLRPSFSEDQAYLKRVTTTTGGDPPITTTDTIVHQDFGYQGGLRAYFGYRCECNEEIRFTYWNYGATSAQSTGVAPDDGSVIYAGQLELNTTPGQHINVQSGLRKFVRLRLCEMLLQSLQ